MPAWIPIPAWMKGYRRSLLGADVLAAVGLVAVAVPSQLATSRLAGMPPITGLYAFAAGAVVFALLGRNRQLVVGADSTIAPLFAAGISHLAPMNTPTYVALVGITAVMVGALVAVVGLIRFGWIAEFLSAPIITGFLAGVAVVIVVHQLPDLFGLAGGSGTTVQRIDAVVRALGHTNGWDAGIGLGVLALALVAQKIDRRLPVGLVGLVASTVLVALADLSRRGVAVLGSFSHGLPHLGLSHLSISTLGSIVPIAGVVALVVVTQTAATSRAFADRRDDPVDIDRDLVGTGAGGIVAGLVGAFPVNASPGMTNAVADAGGRTQVATLLGAAVVVAAIPLAGLLRDLPDAALAGVLLYIAVRLFQVRELVAILRFDLLEAGLALVTLVTVALVGVEQGIAVAVGLAILDRARLSARPNVHVMERIPGTTSWRPTSPGEEPREEAAGVLVLNFASPLYYATANRFRAQVESAMRAESDPVHAVVIDVSGMHDLDFTGARVLGHLLDSLDRRHVALGIARAGEHARGNLERSGLLKRIGADHFYDSVDEAVDALQTPPPAAAAPAT
jgi:SulP family sulfate permease